MENTSARQVLEEKLSGLSADKRALLEMLLGQKDPGEGRARDAAARELTATELKLKKIWEQVLNVPDIEVSDNFFELGGDSIQCIQIVSRCRREGLRISTALMFENPTVESLAKVAEKNRSADEDGGSEARGEVPLLPVQNWFFDLELSNPNHWNQAVMLEVRADAAAEAIEKAWQIVFDRHEALRFRYREEGGKWIQENAGERRKVSFERVDLSPFAPSARAAEMRRRLDAAQSAFDLSAGFLFRVVLFEAGRDEAGRMLVAAHHVAVDGLSFRVMLEDFELAYRQLTGAEEVSLPPKTTSPAEWARRLHAYSESAAPAAEVDFWNGVLAKEKTVLPRDFERGANTESSVETATVFCPAAETETLLQKTLPFYRARINDVLLCALSEALEEWTRRREFLIYLEGHGREEIIENVDLSRTVGWFTSIFPVHLALPPAAGRAARLAAVKRQLALIPRRGVGYGILRNSAEREIREKLSPAAPAELVFNYLGQFDGVLVPDLPFAPADEDPGKLYDGENLRPFLVQVVGRIVRGRFSATFYYSRNFHEKGTIEKFAARFIESLRALIRDSESPRAVKLLRADFPHSTLTDADFARLDEALRDAAGNVEDVYALAPIQEGLLFHSLAEPEAGIYLEQGVCEIRGKLDPEKFRRAWESVQRRHSILRTAFVWKSLSLPQQIVFRRVELPLAETDWRGVPAEKREADFEEFLRADRRAGIELTEAPLFRLNLIRTEDECRKFVWTIHHLINDSWSTTAILREVFELYREGGEKNGASAPPYCAYVEWLEKQDAARAEQAWREELRGFGAPTPLAIDRPPAAPVGKEKYRRGETVFSERETAAVNRFAAAHRLTVNTLFQAAWGLCLTAFGESRDVVFGGVVSGRPTELENSENLAGVLINTLPVRLKSVPDAELLSWLRELQERQGRLRQYEYLPLKTIQKLSEIPAGENLFDSVLVFQNATAEFEGAAFGGLKIENVRYLGYPNYPLTLRVWLGRSLKLETLFDTEIVGAGPAREILETVKELVLHLIAAPAEKVSGAVRFVRRRRQKNFRSEPGERRSLFESRLKKRDAEGEI